MSIHWFADLWW